MANAEFLQPLSLPAITVSGLGTAAGFAVDNASNDYAGVIWRSAGGVATGFLQIDFGVNVDINRLMLFGLSGFPANATVRIYSSTNAQGATYAGWVSSALPVYAGTNRLPNGRGVSYVQMNEAGGPPPSRYWRIEFGALANAAVEIGRIVMGKAYSGQRNFSFGGAFGIRDFSKVDFSARGALLRTRRPRKLRTVGISFSMAYRDEVEATVQPLLEAVGLDGPLALIVDPDANAMRERRCYFGLLQGDLGSIWRSAKAWEWRADMVSLF
jgi:hypothetical protein